MIKEIVKDTEQLQIICKVANIKTDLHIIQDLVDTANEANKPPESEEEPVKGCCGLAANQIGYDKRIVIVEIRDGDKRGWLPLNGLLI
jgi:peptide deformylase